MKHQDGDDGAWYYEPLRYDLGDTPKAAAQEPEKAPADPDASYRAEVSRWVEEVLLEVAPGPHTDPDAAEDLIRARAKERATERLQHADMDECLSMLSCSESCPGLWQARIGGQQSWLEALRSLAIREMSSAVRALAYRGVLRAWGGAARAQRLQAWPAADEGTVVCDKLSKRILVRIPMRRARAVLFTPQEYGGPCSDGRRMLRKWAGPAGLTMEGMTHALGYLHARVIGLKRPTDEESAEEPDISEPQVYWFIHNICPPNTRGRLLSAVKTAVAVGAALHAATNQSVYDLRGVLCMAAIFSVAQIVFYEEEEVPEQADKEEVSHGE